MGKSQHTVPQTYLRSFSDQTYPQKEKPIWYLDKSNGEIRPKGISNFLEFNHFYSFVNADGSKDEALESYLCRLETDFTRLRNRLAMIPVDFPKTATQFNISEQEQVLLSYFVIWQLKRTFHFVRQLESNFRAELLKDGIVAEVDAKGSLLPEQRNYVLSTLAQLGEADHMHFASSLFKRNVIFTVVPPHVNSGFITSDNPVMRTNAFGKPGLVDPKTEISLPLTPRIALSFFEFGNNCHVRPIVDSAVIRNMNKSLALNAHQYVIGPSERQLQRMKKAIQPNRTASRPSHKYSTSPYPKSSESHHNPAR